MLDKEYAEEYVEGAIKTKSPHYHSDSINQDLVHAILGIVTETAEFVDGLGNKDSFHADRVNLKEEIGDICWYLAIAQNFYNKDNDEGVDIFGEEPYDIKFKKVDTFCEMLVVTSGELADVVKRSFYYGKGELTPQIYNLPYLFMKVFKICQSLTIMLNADIDKIMKTNLDKLQQRFPDKFNTEKVFDRDLEKEREILEQK